MRGASYPTSKTMMMSASPGRHWPACTSRVTTSRSWASVTVVASSDGPGRIASSAAVQDVRSVSSAATKE